MCEVACPAELLPQQLFWFAKAEEFEKARDHNLSDCIECGACAFVCPSQIPLVQYYRFAKGRLKHLDHEAQIAEQSRIRFENREQRLLDNQLAKEEKRKARAEAAAAAQAAKRAANPDQEDPIKAAMARVAAQKLEKEKATKPKTHVEVYKELKTAAAITRTKLNKTAKALADAKTKGLELESELQATFDELTIKGDQAKAALANYEAEQGLDPEKEKELQVAVAKANAAVRKLEKSLATAEDSKAVEAEIELAMVTLEKANKALSDHQNIVKSPSTATKEP
jgi:electron transport complex protein RnfC